MPTCPKLVLTVLPQDGFIPHAEDNSTIRLPPPHEIAQPVASSGPYYPFPPVSRHSHSAALAAPGVSLFVRDKLENTDSSDEYLEFDADDASTHPEPELLQDELKELPTIPSGAVISTSTAASAPSMPYTAASLGTSELAATTERLGRPSILPTRTTATQETPRALPHGPPPPADASGSATAVPVPPMILSTPQERMPTPEQLSSVSQEFPVSSPGTSIPVQALPDTGSVLAAPSSSSRSMPLSTSMKGREIISVPSSVVMKGSPTSMTGGTVSVLPSAVQRGDMTGGSTMSVLPSAVRRGVPAPMTLGGTMPVSSVVRRGSPTPMRKDTVLPSAVRRSVPAPMTGGGSMSVPSSVIKRGSAAQTMPSVIKFNEYGEFPELLCYSPHSVVYEDKLYPTALHLFEARKFLPHLPDLADRIRQCERVEQVASITAEMADFIRRDWGNVMLNTVSKSPLISRGFGKRTILTDRLLLVRG